MKTKRDNIDKSTYIKNNFQVGKYCFTIETLKGISLRLKQFAIITAFNPKNKPLSEIENISKNIELEKDISVYKYEKSVGFLDNHKEDSFCIYDISFEKAIELGKKYKQYSIFFNYGKTCGYYLSSDSTKIL